MLWVQCDRCLKWRVLVEEVTIDEGSKWFCEMSTDEQANSCEAPQTSQCHEVSSGFSSDLFFVDHICDERAALRGTKEYLVRWLGWGAEHDSWEPERNIHDKSLIADFHQNQVSRTANITPVTWAFVADHPILDGRGLFARAPLQAGQAICEYGGPRLPTALQARDGKYVMQLPKTRIIVDGNCDNVGDYQLPRYAAIFANHSATPNARIEYWPDLSAIGSREYELSGHMWIVASEPIEQGQEIRFDYEAGGNVHDYWLPGVAKPIEGAWRDLRVPVVGLPVPDEAAAAIDVLDALREASELSRAKRCRFVVPRVYTRAFAGMTLEAVTPLSMQHADERIRELAPVLARTDNKKTWGLLATHIPGWSGKQCHQRWVAMGKFALQNQLEPQGDAESHRKRVAAILRTMK